MDYEKMYNDLKTEHDTMVTTFESFKTESQKEKETLEGKLSEKDTVLGDKDAKINELQQANISLYLKIPQQQEQQQKQQETSKGIDEILKEIGGSF